MTKRSKGLLITFEGGEGGGKSTQMKRLAARLKKAGIPSVLTLQPGGTDMGRALRGILLDPRRKKVSPRAELLLYEADRAQHVDELVAPALAAGRVVLSDRFGDSSTVYQGMCRKLGVARVEALNAFATDRLAPDLTLVLDLPVEVGFARLKKRGGKKDRLEREAKAFHDAVRRGFLTLARRHPRRFAVIDATRSEDEVAAEIEAVVFRKLGRRK